MFRTSGSIMVPIPCAITKAVSMVVHHLNNANERIKHNWQRYHMLSTSYPLVGSAGNDLGNGAESK